MPHRMHNWWTSASRLGLAAFTASARLTAAYSTQTSSPWAPTGQNASEFDWLQITPSPQLIFHPCHGDLQCARLDVPMDYSRSDGKGSRVALAIIKKPAKVDVTDPRYGGTMLTNPGGPGGSGVQLILGKARELQAVIDASSDPHTGDASADGKYFDVLSWDPRAVGSTTPELICFPDASEQMLWTHIAMSLALPNPESVAGTFDLRYARNSALVASCSSRLMEHDDDEDALVEHINTAVIVKDIVSIVEALGEWREAEARRLLSLRKRDAQRPLAGAGAHAESSILDRTRWRRGHEKLQYWGFSYGTVLGATFAHMEPDRVDRLVIDGVADTVDYYGTQIMAKALADTEANFQKFFEYCAAAGPSKCVFSRHEASTAEELRDEYDAILANLTTNPLPVVADGEDTVMFGVATADMLKMRILKSLYSPITNWPIVAEVLVRLRRGDGSLLVQEDRHFMPPASWCPSGSCGAQLPYAVPCGSVPDPVRIHGLLSILCSDADLGSTPMTPTDGRDYTMDLWKAARDVSPLAGDIWAALLMGCPAWKAQSKLTFKTSNETITSHPLLILNPTLDPVCPIQNAHATAARFPGAVVLAQDTPSHCTLNAASLCTAKHVRTYFQTGALPAAGLTCLPNEYPFLGAAEDVFAAGTAGLALAASREDERLLEAVRGLKGAAVLPVF